MSENENNGLSLNKFSFYVIGTIAMLYIVTMILNLVKISSKKIIPVLSGIAAACTIVVVAILAWRYVKHKTTSWKILYLVFMALIVVGVMVPLLV